MGTFKDAGGKAIHMAPDTTSRIVSKSISLDDGLTAYRGLVRMNEGAKNAKSHVQSKNFQHIFIYGIVIFSCHRRYIYYEISLTKFICSSVNRFIPQARA